MITSFLGSVFRLAYIDVIYDYLLEHFVARTLRLCVILVYYSTRDYANSDEHSINPD